MRKNLYFIPLIAEALQMPNPHHALIEAFKEIERLSKEPGYIRGFSQFQRFMSEVKKNWKRPNQVPEEALHEIVKKLDGSIAIFSETETEAAYIAPAIIIKKDGEHINSIKIEKLPVTKEIKNMKPGHYEFMLNTGRLLWEDTLTEKDLLWAYAFPEQDLPLAADTGETIPRPTREIRLLNGEVIILIFPEIETGHIEIEVRD